MSPITNIGVIGYGNISNIYLKNIRRFRNLNTVAVADLDSARAEAKAAEHGVPKALSPEQLLADPDVQIVLNLTVPKAHAEVAMQAIQAGKHVYNEKPLSIDLMAARQLLDSARAQGLRVGCAPDTFLGASLQSCRRLIDDGAIGEPLGATGFMMGRGPEPWHPDPEFFYKPGGGPLLDMGPYYITALVNLMGGIKRVTGSARASFPERTVGSGVKEGSKIKVEIPTHIAGVLDFAGGPVATLVTSFDVSGHQHTELEIYGTEGSLRVPDPNNFNGTIELLKHGEKEWREQPLTHSLAEDSRGAGLSDMAEAIEEYRPHRASGDLAYHVLEAMLGILDASEKGRHVGLSSMVERPDALPIGLPEDALRP